MAEQQAPRTRATAQKPAARSGISPAVRDAARETAVGLFKGKAVETAFGEQPSYLKAAFLNPYNLSLLGGAAAVLHQVDHGVADDLRQEAADDPVVVRGLHRDHPVLVRADQQPLRLVRVGGDGVAVADGERGAALRGRAGDDHGGGAVGEDQAVDHVGGVGRGILEKLLGVVVRRHAFGAADQRRLRPAGTDHGLGEDQALDGRGAAAAQVAQLRPPDAEPALELARQRRHDGVGRRRGGDDKVDLADGDAGVGDGRKRRAIGHLGGAEVPVRALAGVGRDHEMPLLDAEIAHQLQHRHVGQPGGDLVVRHRLAGQERAEADDEGRRPGRQVRGVQGHESLPAT